MHADVPGIQTEQTAFPLFGKINVTVGYSAVDRQDDVIN